MKTPIEFIEIVAGSIVDLLQDALDEAREEGREEGRQEGYMQREKDDGAFEGFIRAVSDD